MPDPVGMIFRAARPGDADAVAGLHADSWRRHYRGAYSDAFLDGDVAGYLTAMWTDRLAAPKPGARTILAECDSRLAGWRTPSWTRTRRGARSSTTSTSRTG